MTRRGLLAAGVASRALASAAARPEIVNAYYFRAHMYTLVPRHVREDLRWMADNGCNALTLAVLEQDFTAAVANIEFVIGEAGKMGLKVFATPSRWAGLTAGAPKVPSLFSAGHPETWMLNEDGTPAASPGVSAVISSVHHPLTYQFFCESVETLFRRFDFAGLIWDEPKGFRPDYSKRALEKLGRGAPKAAHAQAAADFYARVSRTTREKFPRKTLSMFVKATAGTAELDVAARIAPLDYFGCDGRPWDMETDRQWAGGGADQESGKGKVLLGKGEAILALARKHGKKGLFLAENHNLPAKMIPAMEKGLPRVLAAGPEQLIFYYYPRNIEEPERNMAAIARALKTRRL